MKFVYSKEVRIKAFHANFVPFVSKLTTIMVPTITKYQFIAYDNKPPLWERLAKENQIHKHAMFMYTQHHVLL